MLSSHPKPNLFRVDVLKGKAEILEQSLLLEELAERCDQAGAMHWLQHFLTVPTFRGKKPYLLLGVEAIEGDAPNANNVRWAVLMYEFNVLCVGMGIFSTDDISGFRTVIAPVSQRETAVTQAADALLRYGAQIAMVSYANDRESHGGFQLRTDVLCRWAIHARPVANTLPLKETYEATLMSLGKATRFNMRYYRRRLARRMACELVSDARGLFSEGQIDAMNSESLNPFTQTLARMQYASAHSLPGSFLLLLRSASGQWLSLVGGWRQAETTVLLWQMNRAGFERDSLGTVMRSYFIEHEVDRGAKRIVFYGGTQSSVQNSFVQGTVVDLVMVRTSWKARMLRHMLGVLATPHWWMKHPNFLARAVCSESIAWHESKGSDGTAKIETE